MAKEHDELQAATEELTHSMTRFLRALDAVGDSEAASHLSPGFVSNLERLSTRLDGLEGLGSRPPGPAPRGGRVVSSDQDLEAERRPRLRGKEEPGPRALRHRRWHGQAWRRGSDRGHLLRRVRTAQPPAPSGQAVGTGRNRPVEATEGPPSATTPGHLHPAERGPAPHGRLRPLHRPASTVTSSTRKGRTEFLAFLPLPAHPATHSRSGSPSCSTTSARTCRPRTTRRVTEWAEANNVELAYTPTYSSLAEPDRGPVPGTPLLRPRRHRPRQPQGAGLDDPPLHHLAQPQCTGPGPT